jgi:diadenosine tetraphosphatase ApaH/serine/threonine PP2A family protein phosphatase
MPAPYGILHFQERMSVKPDFLSNWLSQLSTLGLHKYSENVYEACIRSFCALPIAGLVDGKFFCVHGGLSPQLMHLRDLDNVSFRFQGSVNCSIFFEF